MATALALAGRGRGRTSPNPLVGAVIVDDAGVVVGTGFHERAGEAHAEVHALRAAGARARGATLYCTLEPCSHTGRTGPCAVAVADAGIRRVVAAMQDPYPEVAGRGFAYLREHGVEVEVGVREAEAQRLNEVFVTNVVARRPFVVAKIAISLDNAVAAAPGARTTVSGAASQRHAQRVRAEVAAIGIGSGTLLADDPVLTARDVWRARPLIRVVFDRRLRMPPEARLCDTLDRGPVLLVTTRAATDAHPDRAHALAGRGVTILAARRRRAGAGDRRPARLRRHLAAPRRRTGAARRGMDGGCRRSRPLLRLAGDVRPGPRPVDHAAIVRVRRPRTAARRAARRRRLD